MKYLPDLDKWIDGEDKPSWEDLRIFARICRTPTYIYFLKKPPKAEYEKIEDKWKWNICKEVNI